MSTIRRLLIFLTVICYVQCQNCGVPQVQQIRRKRVVNGTRAAPHSHPWLVSIRKNGAHWCGGTLIRVPSMEDSTNVVLTAAHCVVGESNVQYSIMAGEDNINQHDNGEQIVNIAAIHAHVDYDHTKQRSFFKHDIALLKLERSIAFSNTIQPICLPTESDSVSVEDRTLIVAGWDYYPPKGDNSIYTGSGLLNQANIAIFNMTACDEMFSGKPRINPDTNETMFYIHVYPESQICAGGDGRGDSCQYDSGGPLIGKEGDHYVQYGIVSWALICGLNTIPGVNTKVSAYTQWINNQLTMINGQSS